jgi:hypothetical protein
MTTATAVDPTVDAPPAWADRTGRVLLALCSVATLGALAQGFTLMQDSSDQHLMTEAWRTFAYVVFAGLWALLAIAPRRSPGIWELLFAHKIGITVFAAVMFDLPTAPRHVLVDGLLVGATAAAYVACRGWQSWRHPFGRG